MQAHQLLESIRDLGDGLCLIELFVPRQKTHYYLDLDKPYKLDNGTQQHITRAIAISVPQ